jgi:uncharacterized protein YdeI (YjbR/CyaY-like superfamily)
LERVTKRQRSGFPDEHVHPQTRAEWRAWLEARHASSTGVWLVTWKKATGKPRVEYDDAVEEALCYGWIDSLGRTLDDERSRLLFTPRKPGSGWSRPNKQRVERLLAAGLMRPAGLAVVEAAQADGSWSSLDDVENLVEPDDLRTALDADPEARRQWDGFPRSAKRGILEWVQSAKRPETRGKRIAETAELAARGERANQWRGRR